MIYIFIWKYFKVIDHYNTFFNTKSERGIFCCFSFLFQVEGLQKPLYGQDTSITLDSHEGNNLYHTCKNSFFETSNLGETFYLDYTGFNHGRDSVILRAKSIA